MAETLSPSPREPLINLKNGRVSAAWLFWLSQLQRMLSTAARVAWALVDKVGSNLTDLETRNHNDLQNRSTAAAHPASAIVNTPTGTMAATTVQAAVNELKLIQENALLMCIMGRR